MLRYFYRLIALSFLLSWAGQAFSQNFHPDFWDGKVYLKFKNDYELNVPHRYGEVQLAHLLPHLEYLVNDFGIRKAGLPFYALKEEIFLRTFLLEFDSIEKTAELLRVVQENFGHAVEYIEQVPIDRFDYTPNDLGANTTAGQYALYLIKAREAWDIGRGDTNIVVAIVDDGFYRTHGDLAPITWRNLKEIPGNGIDDDGNGYVDDVWGWDAGNNDGDPLHPNTNFLHGTHVGGIAGAATDNGTGIASIGFGIKIMGVKCTQDASGNTQSVPFSWQGLSYAVAAGADIINCSWSSGQFSSTNQNIVLAAHARGQSIVASAGNSNTTTLTYPAAYNTVIAVASTDINDAKSSFSNFGTWVGISAPGSNIRSTVPTNSFNSVSGTSMASPMVAGLLGLMKSHYPPASLAQLEGCLLNNADNIDSKNASFAGRLGSGRINAERSMQCMDSLRKAKPLSRIQSSMQMACPGAEIQFFGSSAGKNEKRIRWYFPGGNPNTSNIPNPIVKYSNLGDYDVILVTENDFGSDSAVFKNYAMISAEGFEDIYQLRLEAADSLNPDFKFNGIVWTNLNPNKRGITTNTGNPLIGSPVVSSFITPIFNLKNHSNITASLDIAYGRRTNCNNEDSLYIWGSVNGGNDFNLLIKAFRGSELATAGNSNNVFSPLNDNQWCSNCPKIDLDALKGKDSVILKFEFKRKGCGNLFIKEIKLNGMCSGLNKRAPIASLSAADTSFCIPNNVKFSNRTRNFPDSVLWIFEGGNPSRSNDENPEVLYEKGGTFSVKLFAYNQFGVDSLILSNHIKADESPKVEITATDTLICSGESVRLSASGADNYSWSPLVNISASTGQSVTVSPQFTIKYTAAGRRGVCSGTGDVVIWVHPNTIAPTVFRDGMRLYTNDRAVSYQWEIDGQEIPGATNKEYQPDKNGLYRVRITDENGCTANSLYFYFEFGSSLKSALADKIKIYPNPANQQLTIEWLGASQAEVSVSDILGRSFASFSLTESHTSMSISEWPAGVYFLKVNDGNNSAVLRIIVAR